MVPTTSLVDESSSAAAGSSSLEALQAALDEERALRNIDAGELQACDRTFGPYLALPVGSLLQFVGGELHSAHLVDQAKLEEVFERGEYRTMGEVLASGEASRPLFAESD